MSNSSDLNRLQYIDIAKGIAIICIILGHLGNRSINHFVFTFHIPVFFLITGYFISDKRSVLQFIYNKARTLIVPYLIVCMIIIVGFTILGFSEGKALFNLKEWAYASVYGSGDSYTKPFYIKAIGALWFLWASFWGSIFLRVSLNFNKHLRVLFIIGLFMFGYYSRRLFWFPLSLQAGACATLYMYFGYAFRQSKNIISQFSSDLKFFGIIGAFCVWYSFARDFKSFWLVHCDIGRGLPDVFASICACICIFIISYVISIKTKILRSILGYLGRFSLLVLAVHTLEMKFIPWWDLANRFVEHGFPAEYKLYLVILGKILNDLTFAFMLSKIKFVRRAFGYKS